MAKRITFFMALLIASLSFAVAQSSDQYPLVGTWVNTHPNGTKIVIKISKYENDYLLKKKIIHNDGTTTYDNITVTYSSPTLINYYDYSEEWDQDGSSWNNYTCYYSFQFENGRASNRYVRFEYRYVYANNRIEEGGFDMNEKPDYYYKDDPDW